MVDKEQQLTERLFEQFHGNLTLHRNWRAMLNPKKIKSGPGKQWMEGKDFRLAKERKYIQHQAAKHDGRFVTIGPLVFFSTETGDAWMLSLPINLLPDSPAMEIQNSSTLRKPTLITPSAGKVTTASRAAHSSTSTGSPTG